MSNSEQAPSRGPLRNYLMSLDTVLANAANYTWDKAAVIHERQTRVGENVNGTKHVKQVEKNIWKILDDGHGTLKQGQTQLEKLDETEIYLLSCAACCHDFDKGITPEVLEGDFEHGEGSGQFVLRNYERLGIISKAAAEDIARIISVHDCKEDFYDRVREIPVRAPDCPNLGCWPHCSKRRTHFIWMSPAYRVLQYPMKPLAALLD